MNCILLQLNNRQTLLYGNPNKRLKFAYRDNRDRGGVFLGSDRGDDPADFGPRHLPALDFGDRYSANRSKDRERRERFNGSAGGQSEGDGGGFRR